MICYIYTLSHPITNEIRYIGKTINIKKRYNKHINDSKYANSHNRCWINGLIKSNLKPNINIIDVIEKVDSNFWEKHYISLYKSWGFNLTNMTFGGDGGNDFTKETKEKISNSLKGKKQSKETIEKRKISLKKAWENQELRELKRQQTTGLIKLGILSKKYIPSHKKGKPFDGDKIKLSLSLKKYYSDINKRNDMSLNHGAKIFNIYELKEIIRGNRWGDGNVIKGNLIESHHNITYISKKYNIERNHIRRCLKGSLKQIKGYIFSYEN